MPDFICDSCKAPCTGEWCPNCGGPVSAPPRPLQPGDKVLVEAEVLHVYTTDAEVEMTSSTMQIPLFSNRHLAINIPLSSIRPFPQEESNQDRQQTLEKR